MAKWTKDTELPLQTVQICLYLKHHLTCLSRTSEKIGFKKQNIFYSGTLFYGEASSSTIFQKASPILHPTFLLAEENKKVKCKRDIFVPAEQSLTSHLNFPGTVWVVMNHIPQWNHNKDPYLITVCSPSSVRAPLKLESQRLDWSLNSSMYFNLCFCYAKV